MTEEEKNNSNKKDNTFIYRYIPSRIVREWADSSGNVSFVRRGLENVGKCCADDIFTEEYSVGEDTDNLDDLNSFDFSAVSDTLEPLLREKPEFSLLTLGGAALLALSLYYKAPGAPGVSGENERTLENLKDRDSEMKFTLPYLMDLSMGVVDAPEGWEFVLGDHPLYIRNILLSEEEAGSGNPLYNRGLILIIPLTPHRAVMLTDADSCWFHGGKDGRFVLTPEDMWGINDYIRERSSTVVITNEEAYGSSWPSYDGYCSRLLEEMNSTGSGRSTNSAPLLFISVSPDAEGAEGSTIRRGVSRLLGTDALEVVASGLDPDDGEVFGLRIGRVIEERQKKGKSK